MALLGVAHAAPTGGQALEPAAFPFGSDTLHVVVYLDSIGVMPHAGVSDAALESLLGPMGFTLGRTLGGGARVALRNVAYTSIDEAVLAGARLHEEHEAVVSDAGPLARPAAGGLAMVMSDRIMVQYTSSATPGDRASVEADFGLEPVETSPTDSRFRLYRVRLPGRGTYIDVIHGVGDRPETEWAYPDYMEGIASAEVVPNDPLFDLQWYLKNGSGGSGDINATEAWDHTQGSPSVVIAVMEVGGFDVHHPDLAPNLWSNIAELAGTTGVDDDGNGLVDDIHGWNYGGCNGGESDATCGVGDLEAGGIYHGTSVAGLAAATGDNAIGISGVCPRCRLMLLELGGFITGTTAWSRIHAFRYARDMGAWVINASWKMNPDPVFEKEIADIVTMGRGGKGIPVFMSAGNDTADFCGAAPLLAARPQIFSVGATNRNDVRPAWSNEGSCLDLVAPGAALSALVGMTTTDPTTGVLHNPGSGTPDPECAPELSDQAYTKCFGGTSAAAPLTAGTAGLMLSLNPDLTAAQVYEILRTTADKVSCGDALYGGSAACPSSWTAHSDTYGYGRLDAFAAVEGAAAVACATCVTVEESPAGVEIGARLGWSHMTGAADEETWNGPGSGPGGLPVFHVTWVVEGGPTDAGLYMAELQTGWDRVTTGGAKNTSTLVMALQAAYSPVPPWYLAANWAWRHDDNGLAVQTDDAWGVAVGARTVWSGSLALRLEARYRYWGGSSLNEWGVAAALGVMLP